MNKKTRIAVWQKYDCRCAYCGEPLHYKEMQVDHILPPKRGGEDDFENYNPSCRQCNFYKSDFTLEEFREQLKTLHLRISKPFIARLGVKYGIIQITPFDGKFYFEK